MNEKNYINKKIRVYEEKLIDTSGRNRFINFKFNHKNQIRIVDENPNLILERLLDKKELVFKSLTKQSGIPKDELNDRFKNELEWLIEQKYSKNQEELSVEKEWKLRDEVREKLNLKKIERKRKLSNNEHAKELGINNSFDLSFDFVSKKHTDKFLQTLLNPEEFQRNFKYIFQNYKSFEKESGINNLYLCFGFLNWKPAGNLNRSSITVYSTPILLLQITLDKNNDNFKISTDGDFLETNCFLKEKLKNDFNIDLYDIDKFKELNGKINIEKYFENITKQLEKYDFEHEIKNQVAISFFNNQNIFLLKDFKKIYSKLETNPFIRKLIAESVNDENVFDENYEYKDYVKKFNEEHLQTISSLPFEYDSSQFSVILDALNGKNMVVQGPPGTGKSQTIANMIVALINNGKKVLFVAQKEAALNVVKNKLEAKGFKEFLLNIYSHNANKSTILDSINKRWKLNIKNNYDNLYNESQILKYKIEKISNYLNSLNNFYNKTDFNIFDFLWQSKNNNINIFNIKNGFNIFFKLLPDVNTTKKEVFVNWKDNLNKLIEFYKQNINNKKIFEDFFVSKISNFNLYHNEIQKEIEFTNDIFKSNFNNLQKIKNLLKTNKYKKEILDLIKFIGYEKIDKFINFIIDDNKIDLFLKSFQLYCENKLIVYKIKKTIDINLLEKINVFDIQNLKTKILKLNFFNSLFAFKIRNEFKKLNIKIKFIENKNSYLKKIDNLIYFLKLKNKISNLNINYLEFFDNICFDNIDINNFLILLKTFEQIINIKNVKEYIRLVLIKECFYKYKLINFWKVSNLNEFLLEIDDDFNALNSIKRFYLDFDLINKKIEWLKYIKNINNKIVEFFILSLKKDINLLKIIDFFECVIREKILLNFSTNNKFYEFRKSSKELEDNLKELKELDNDIRKKSILFFKNKKFNINLKRYTIYQLGNRYFYKNNYSQIKSNLVGEKRGWNLLNYIKEKTRTKISIRQIFRRSFNELLMIKPCFLMSPNSVAKYLPNFQCFDVVIIDEASQMLVEHSFSSIFRGKQIIVVGDQKQLPPTTFFSSFKKESDDFEEETSESILEAFSIFSNSKKMLQFHYRSNHQDLIKFSNFKFYQNSLNVPPTSIKNVNRGINYIYLENTYYNSGFNEIEAKELLKKVCETIKKRPKESIGVATMNVKQKQYLEKEFELICIKDKKIKDYIKKWESKNDGLEEFFIKNLETVQGDERDIIFISTVYGRDKATGKVFQRFGPINGINGHRRLNVLFTRAKNQMFIFTSLRPEDIIVSEKSSNGLRVFKDFLNFLKDKKLKKIEKNKIEPESEFQKTVINWIQDAGFDCDWEIGDSGFRIDIGVKHKDYNNGYLMAVETDGATYHSLSSARDRDVLRQQILEKSGWHFYRIWSTDFFNNPIETRKKLIKKCNERLNELNKK